MPDPATLARAGLFTTRNAAVPLTGVAIDAQVSNLCARVVVSHRYVNGEATPIEAVYVFPLDEGAAVCGFEAIIDGTLVVGEAKEREEAFALYDDAMQGGHGAYLLDEERPDVFQASVGNLPPGKEVLLKLTYVTELAVDNGSVRFVIPTTVSPRYAPAKDQVAVGRPDSETLNPPLAWTVPYGLNVKVQLAMSSACTRVESPSHPIAVSTDGNGTTVTLSQQDAALDRDFVLAIDANTLRTPCAWVERTEDGTGAVAIGFVPEFPQAQAPAEVVFLVDRSGSMDGTSIQEVRNALQLCLRSMIPGCYFNIIGFGSSTDPLFPESRLYDDSTLGEASTHVGRLGADLGGTELLPALQLALAGAPHASRPRQIVVLTDGEVTNTDAVLALARAHAAKARIFTFGIGAGASHHLVKGLARAGGGAAEFIFPGERIEPKVVRQFGRLLSPALTNVRIDWGGLDVTPAPAVAPPVFAGGRLLVYGMLRAEPQTGSHPRIRLLAEASSGPLSFDVTVDLADSSAGATVTALAARARIRELEESPEWLTSRGSRQRDRKAAGVRREIVDLAVRYGLVSRETSYVAIERRETPVIGDVQLRRVPVALTSGWGGVGRLDRFAAAWSMPHFARSLSVPDTWSDDGVVAFRASLHAAAPTRSAFGSVRRSRAFQRPFDLRAPMHALVALQHAGGTWELTRDLAAIIGIDPARAEAALHGASGEPSEIRTAWATALAIAWLHMRAGQYADEWRLLAEKSRTWLDRVTARPADGNAWLHAAEAFLMREECTP